MTICYIILALAVLAFLCCNVLKSLHMFQLNSYKVPTHMRWLRGNRATLIPGIFTGGLTALALALQLQPIAACILLAVVFVLFAVMGRPKKAKKPLVYTNRVKRMILTMVIILALLSAAAIALGHSGALVIICVTALCSPFLVLLANTINKPVEKGINRYYINDAKKILSGCKNLTVIGVTGSYGKTSVKYILSTLLQAKYNVLMTPESYNTPMGVVITVRQHLRATHQVFVCEMGARHVGDIKELCDIAHPHMGIITSVGPQHLETFHSIENVTNLSWLIPCRATASSFSTAKMPTSGNIGSMRRTASSATVFPISMTITPPTFPPLPRARPSRSMRPTANARPSPPRWWVPTM